jgi:hypothetical protein
MTGPGPLHRSRHRPRRGAILLATGLIAARLVLAPMPSGAQTPQNAASDDIRDIRGPKMLLPIWFWPAVVAGGALIALAGYGLWRWSRRPGLAVTLTLYELALQRLEDIRSLMQPQSARAFSIAVSDIVRGYIEERFQVTAAHRTTEEFLHDLRGSSDQSLSRHRALLDEFLQQCDLAKFAGMSLSHDSMEALHRSARTFVLETGKSAASS